MANLICALILQCTDYTAFDLATCGAKDATAGCTGQIVMENAGAVTIWKKEHAFDFSLPAMTAVRQGPLQTRKDSELLIFDPKLPREGKCILRRQVWITIAARRAYLATCGVRAALRYLCIYVCVCTVQ